MRTFFLTITFFALATISIAQLPTISAFAPTSAATGTTVTITGTNFTGATDVTFGGTPAASFTVVSATQITAVVAGGSSGQVQVTTAGGTGSRANFFYVTTSRIVTDFGGYWSSTAGSPNVVKPDNSHNLLAFTYDGTMFSTGANDGVLTGQGLSYTPGNFRALPVAGIAGTVSGGSTYLVLGRNVDGSASVYNTPAVKDFTIRSVLTDGIKGLNLGTGVTNLPPIAVLTFQIYGIDPTKLADAEPDILITQIADPSAGNDLFSFIDASGAVVGISRTQDMTVLPSFGLYWMDLFTLTPNTPYNVATAYSSTSPGDGDREIRVVGFKLSDFGITPANVGQVAALKITPSSNSDYAFIGYNANAISLSPNVTQNPEYTNTTLCSGGTANLSVLAVPADGGTLSYTWEESSNGGSSWTPVTNGGNYSGATSSTLSVSTPTDDYQYRAIVTETGNSNPATSTVFIIDIVPNPTAPSDVTITPTSSTVCLNSPVQLTASVTGGTNISYQWQSDATGSFVDIPGATLNRYTPPVDQTGTISYLLRVSSGSGCTPSLTSSTPGASVTVTGIASTVPAEICGTGSVVLNATATSGSVSWFDVDAGGSALATGTSFPTPVLSSTKTYYVVSSTCPTAFRVPVTATISPATAGGTIAGSAVVVSGTNSTTLTLSGITGAIIKWQSSTDDFNTAITDIANTTTQLTVTNLTQTTKYRAEIQSGSCTPEFSSIATIAMSGTLSIHSGSVRASKVNEGILVQWTAFDQQSTDRYEVERSTDGSSFTKIHTAFATDNGSSDTDYKFLDKNPVGGANFYRIKEVYKSGNHQYSSIVKLVYENNSLGISIYPNPVMDRNLSLQFNEVAAGAYRIRIISSIGQVVHKMSITHLGGSRSQTLSLPQKIVKGLYKVEISGPAGSRKNYSVLIL